MTSSTDQASLPGVLHFSQDRSRVQTPSPEAGVLRLNFHVGHADAPTVMLASFVRFCADGTLRGSDNCVIARCVEGLWQVGGRAHRELDCEGPMRVRVTSVAKQASVDHGPFRVVRTINGVLHADEASLHIVMPGRLADDATRCHELVFLPHAAATNT